MKAKIITFLVSLLFTVFAQLASADVGSKIDSWFNNNNFSNSTNPGVYETQAGRSISLGGISTRAPVTKPINLIDITMPRFSAGCGGIDAYAGGFSHIDADKFIDNLRNIGENAKGLVFMLAIQIISPQLSGIMEEINTWAQRINSLNQGSCEAAMSLVGGAMEAYGVEKGDCIVKRMNNFGEDYNTATDACKTGGKVKETQNDGSPVNIVDFVKGNLAWNILMDDSYFNSDLQAAQLIMNLTGTLLIADEDGDDDGVRSLRDIPPSLTETANDQRFVAIYNGLLFGSESETPLELYMCEGNVTANKDTGCSSVSTTLVELPRNWNGLHKRVSDILVSIFNKIKSDGILTPSEKGLIENVRLPFFRLLSALALQETGPDRVAAMTDDYSLIIAKDLLNSSLNDVLALLKVRVGTISGGRAIGKNVKEFGGDVENALKGISKLKDENRSLFEKEEKMVEEAGKFERNFFATVSPTIQAALKFKG